MQNSLYHNIEIAIAPYLKAWDEWVVSDYCFLSDQEVKTVRLFLRMKSVRGILEKTKRSETTNRIVLRNVRIKLLGGIKIYRYWHEKRKTGKYYPLDVPIACIKGSSRLKRKLFPIANTLTEILSRYTVDELNRKGIGKGLIEELRLLLQRYGCAHRLREKTHSQKLKNKRAKNKAYRILPSPTPTKGEEEFRKKYLHILVRSSFSSNRQRTFTG